MASFFAKLEEKREAFVKKAGPFMRWVQGQIWKYHSTLVLIGFPLSVCAKLEMATLTGPMYSIHQQLTAKNSEQRFKALVEQSLSTVPTFAELDSEDDLTSQDGASSASDDDDDM